MFCKFSSRTCTQSCRKQVSTCKKILPIATFGYQPYRSNISYLLYFVYNTIRKKRDELTHKIFCMLQETNKFREHQSREILIELLEKQLAERQKLLEEVQEGIQKADDLLGDNSAATTTSDTAAMDEK